MQCPSCGKTGFVIIGNKRYCSNCGTKLNDQGAPRAISDLKPAQVPAVPTAAPQALSPAAPTTTPPQPGSVVAPKPANQLHGIQVGGKAPAILDLRSKTQPSAPSNVEPIAVNQEAPKPNITTPTESPVPIEPRPEQAPPTTVSATPLAQTSNAPAPAQIQKPIAQPAPFSSPASVNAPSADSGSPQSGQVTTTHPKVKRFPENPAVAAAASQTPLPNQVSTQIDAMKKLATEGDVEPKSEGLKEVLATAKPSSSTSFTQIAAAIAAIGIITGIVWMQNSPKMAFKSASSQAGIEASLPTYVPSSYRQQGSAQVAPGQVTLTYSSPSSQNPLTITQKRTSWDSNSLRENYVSRQSDNMLAVQGQGLTIFLYNNQASWVNHGIWYTVSGTDNLSREQILRVAYGL